MFVNLAPTIFINVTKLNKHFPGCIKSVHNIFSINPIVEQEHLISVCPQTHPVLSLREAFFVTKQSQSLYKGIASAKNASQ